MLGTLQEYNSTHCEPPLEKEVETIYQSVTKRNEIRSIPLTDLGNSERFISNANGQVFYCPENGTWLGCTGGTYQQSETLPYENAKATVKSMSNEVINASNPQALLKWIKTSQSVARIDAMIKLAQKDRRISKKLSLMDTDDQLINLKNGVFNFADFKLLANRGSQFLTKQAETSFVENADCKLWKEFIRQITDDDEEMSRQLQKAVGYTLTGMTEAQLFFVCTGNGANGKSVFLETIDYLMGTYSGKISASALTGGAANKIPNELAGLTGKRFVTVSEMPMGEIVNTTTLKS